MGFGASMSRRAASTGAELVGRFLVFERGLELALPRGIGREGVPGLGGARGLDGEEIGGEIAHGAAGLLAGLGPARAGKRVELRARFAGTDVFRNEMRLGDGDVEARRFVGGTGRRVLEDEAFLPGGGGLAGFRALLEGGQAAVDADAALEMDDVIAFLEFREVDLEHRAHGLRMRRLESARALYLIASVDLGVGDDDGAGVGLEEAARENAEVRGGPRFAEPVFVPEFEEALALAVVAAEHVDGVFLAKPAMALLEKFASLFLGQLRVGQHGADRSVCIESRTGERRAALAIEREFGEVDARESAVGDGFHDAFPRDEKRVAGGDLRELGRGERGGGFGFDEEEDGVRREVIEERAERGRRAGSVGAAAPGFESGLGSGSFGERGLRIRPISPAGGMTIDWMMSRDVCWCGSNSRRESSSSPKNPVGRATARRAARRRRCRRATRARPCR